MLTVFVIVSCVGIKKVDYKIHTNFSVLDTRMFLYLTSSTELKPNVLKKNNGEDLKWQEAGNHTKHAQPPCFVHITQSHLYKSKPLTIFLIILYWQFSYISIKYMSR